MVIAHCRAPDPPTQPGAIHSFHSPMLNQTRPAGSDLSGYDVNTPMHVYTYTPIQLNKRFIPVRAYSGHFAAIDTYVSKK